MLPLSEVQIAANRDSRVAEQAMMDASEGDSYLRTARRQKLTKPWLLSIAMVSNEGAGSKRSPYLAIVIIKSNPLAASKQTSCSAQRSTHCVRRYNLSGANVVIHWVW